MIDSEKIYEYMEREDLDEVERTAFLAELKENWRPALRRGVEVDRARVFDCIINSMSYRGKIMRRRLNILKGELWAEFLPAINDFGGLVQAMFGEVFAEKFERGEMAVIMGVSLYVWFVFVLVTTKNFVEHLI